MIFDITKPTPPEMPSLNGKGLEALKLLLSQTSKDMHAPLLPMLFPVLGSKVTGADAEFQYPSGQWLELCGMLAALVADSGNNKGQLGLLVEAIKRDERRSDQVEIKKYLEYQKTFKKRQTSDKPDAPDLCLRCLPSDATRPGYLKAQMAAEAHGGYTTFIDLPEIDGLNGLCGGHKQVTHLLRLMFDRQIYQALRATVDGITGSALLRTNITMSATPSSCREFFKSNLFDGTLGRVVFSYKPRADRDGRIPRIGKFSDEFYEQLDQYLTRLTIVKGRYVIRPLNKVIERLAVEMAELADLTDSNCLHDMGKRSLISAFKAGCVMWALNNMTWTRAMGDMVEYLVWSDTFSKWHVLGDMLIQDGTLSTNDNEKKGPANMLDSIHGTTFSEQQLDALRQSLGKPIGADTKRQLRVWSARGFITYSSQTGLYTITEEYLKKSKSKK
ncbi:MAG: hypothetical protein K6G08_07295 [Prevotella sp.]|nr:hypothetical protein [Prevotella sp.]